MSLSETVSHNGNRTPEVKDANAELIDRASELIGEFRTVTKKTLGRVMSRQFFIEETEGYPKLSRYLYAYAGSHQEVSFEDIDRSYFELKYQRRTFGDNTCLDVSHISSGGGIVAILDIDRNSKIPVVKVQYRKYKVNYDIMGKVNPLTRTIIETELSGISAVGEISVLLGAYEKALARTK